MKYTEKQKENIRKVFIKEMKRFEKANEKGLFKNLGSDIEKEKNKMNKEQISIHFLRNEVKREQSNKKYWIDKYSELEQFIFDLLHSNDNLNIKYGSKFDEIRNK